MKLITVKTTASNVVKPCKKFGKRKMGKIIRVANPIVLESDRRKIIIDMSTIDSMTLRNAKIKNRAAKGKQDLAHCTGHPLYATIGSR
ncbi:hypothetical protein F2Q65_10975 [Thiohalocapsa marina]|uniref:Uncharacterized protein n=1 Tax=Thiohalocapsa marina TaxID=424902 RepID=A0A5M8FIR1_9GAMM|nr:hypothetical protein [Thiohalocapsa marina]KAA6184828.1 hypothetical protein F2Q65_10975 [Thiohalocapsa marina]